MNRIKQLRLRNGMKQAELAKDLGVSQATLSGWENGKFEPDVKTMNKLSKIFDVSIDYLLGNDPPQKNYRRIPVLGEIPAGVPIEAIQDVLDWEDLDEKDFPPWYEYIGLQVKGDSMMPDYHDKDVLIVRMQSTADTGDDAVVFVNGDEATFKRILRREDGVMLRPLNPAYEPLFFSNEEIEELPVTILGVAVEFRRKLKQ